MSKQSNKKQEVYKNITKFLVCCQLLLGMGLNPECG